ncbi:hypothetical protein [Chakrabartyella piscis]|uniref:hypothetical protein n=1 Tax=Chakrabartyella piscis TaxID=2918914 RepID=UPI0029587F9A|nr:hypothetical protein [Chakrabartyella piscis]
MKGKQKRELKKKIVSVLALVLAMIMVLSLFLPYIVQAADIPILASTVEVQGEEMVYETENLVSIGQDLFDVSLSDAENNQFIANDIFALALEVTNKGKDFSGTLEVQSYTSYAGDHKEYVTYYEDSVWASGETKEIHMDIAIGAIHDFVNVYLKDVTGTVVYQDRIQLKCIGENPFTTDDAQSEIANSLRYVSGNFPPFSDTTLYMMMGLLVVYLLLVGPVTYLVLRKMGKRELAWVVIPVLSVSFMAIVFGFAQSSTYKNGLLQRVTYVELAEDSTETVGVVDIAIKTADSGTMAFRSEEGISVTIPFYEYNYNQVDRGEEAVYHISQGSGEVVMEGVYSSWETEHLQTTIDMDLGGHILCDIELEDGNYVGTVANNTNVNFQEAGLSLDGYYHKIGVLAAGEMVEISVNRSELQSLGWSIGSGRNYGNVRTEVANGTMTRVEAFDQNQKEGFLYRVGRQRDFSVDVVAVTFFGFDDTNLFDAPQYVNEKEMKESNLTLYRQDFWIPLSEMESFTQEIDPKIGFDGDMDVWADGYSDRYQYALMKETGEATFTYTMPKNVQISEMTWVVGTEEMYAILNGEYFAKNQVTGKYDLIGSYDGLEETYDDVKFGNYQVISLDVDLYLSKEGLVEIMVPIEEGYEFMVPKLEVTGGGLHVGN